MEWYIPITIIPGIGLIIISTSNLVIALNNEIITLNKERDKYGSIIEMKIFQLKRLNWAMVFLYSSTLLFLLSGLFAATTDPLSGLVNVLMIAGVFISLIAIATLIWFGFRSILIREKHLKL